MSPLAWALLAAALALAGAGSRVGGSGVAERTRHRASTAGARSFRFSPSALTVGAGLAAAALCVTVAGTVVGGGAALILGPAAAAITRRLTGVAPRRGPVPGLPLSLDLTAAALRAGRPVPLALRLGAPALPAAEAEAWRRAAGLLALGAEPEQAWAVLAAQPASAPLAAVARRSADSGVRLARALAQLAAESRAELRADALARAERAGVAVLAPLGLCFLPAFVCLGIVPTVVGIARSVLPGLV